MKKAGIGRISQIGCVVLMVIMVVLLFTPYWQYDGQETSVSSLVWFPTNHEDLMDWLKTETGSEVNLNSEVGTPILLTVLGIASVVFLFIWRDVPVAQAVGVGFGAVGIFGYLSSSVLKAGSLWGVHLALCIAVLALSVLGCVEALGGNKKNRAAA